MTAEMRRYLKARVDAAVRDRLAGRTGGNRTCSGCGILYTEEIDEMTPGCKSCEARVWSRRRRRAVRRGVVRVFTHGTPSGYKNGCRCDPCSKANLDYNRDRREMSKALRAAARVPS